MFINSLPNDVTWFSSSQVGAPQMMGGSNGDLLKVLDACLINGLGSKSVVNVTVDGDAVTLGFGVGHGYLERQRVLVSGANDPLLNGNHRIVSMTNNTVTLNIAGVSDTTGTITAKIAPLGYESMFGDTDELRRAYRSTSSTSSKRVLFLDMTYPASAGYHATMPAKRAMVSVCEGMDVLGEQIGSITDTINNFATNPNGSLLWYQKRGTEKTSAVTNDAAPWKVIGNADFFYLVVGWSLEVGSERADVFGFGEFAPLGASSQDRTFLIASKNPNDTGLSGIPDFGATFTGTNTSNPEVLCMSASGLQSKYLSVLSVSSASFEVLSGGAGMSYPNGTGSALFTHPIRLGRGGENILGVMPSILFIENNMAVDKAAHDGSMIDDVLAVHVHYKRAYSTKSSGYYGFYLGD